ncbi:hypothetical protein CBL_11882 [Carabus blaptoides fortunei]
MFKLFALVFAAILAVVAAKPGVYSPAISTYAGYTGYPYGYSAGYASPYAYSAGYAAPYSAGYVSPYSYSAYNGYAGYKYAGPYSYHY